MHQQAALQDADPVANLLHFREHVGREQHRLALPAGLAELGKE